MQENSIFKKAKYLMPQSIDGALRSNTYAFTSVNNDGESLLKVLIRYGNFDAFKHLIKIGHPINSQDKFGKSALHSAILNDEPKFVKELVENKADLNSVDDYGNTPFFYLGKYFGTKSSDVLKTVHEKINKKHLNYDGESVMHTGIKNGNLDLVKKFIESLGVDVNMRSAQGFPQFFYSSSTEMLQFLFDKGADKMLKIKGSNFLHISTRNNNHETVEFLLKNKHFDVDEKDGNGKSPLHIASLLGFDKIVKILYKYGADVTALNKNHETAFGLAKKKKYYEIASFLKEKGGDVSPDFVSNINFPEEKEYYEVDTDEEDTDETSELTDEQKNTERENLAIIEDQLEMEINNYRKPKPDFVQ